MTNKKFSFESVTEDLVSEEIMNLDGCQATRIGDISVDILKSTVDIHLPFITNSINLSIENGCFPEELKLAEVSPIFKKKDDSTKRITGLSVFYRMCQRFLKESCTIK